MIVTPLVGSLVLFWMIDAEGIIGANLQILMDDPYLSVKSSKLGPTCGESNLGLPSPSQNPSKLS